MKRVAVALLAAIVTAIGLFWPVIFADAGSALAENDTATITSYRADFNVASDGTLTAVETVMTAMPAGKHGIFRFWDVADPADSHVRLTPRDISVSVDSQPATFELLWEGHHRYRVAKIGDPEVLLTPGPHVYRIGYRVDGVLSPGAADSTSVFYWNVVPSGWQMAIQKSVEHVHLPVGGVDPRAGTQFQCAVSSGTVPCEDVRGAGTEDVTIHTGFLGPRTPVTIKTSLAVPAPDQKTLPWSYRYDPVFGRNILVPIVLLLLGALAAVAGAMMAWRTKEDAPGLPLSYAPPGGVGPVQAAYIVNEGIPDKAMTATLLYQAEQKLTKLSSTESGDWVVEGIGTPEQWAATDPVTRTLGEQLGVVRTGGQFLTDGSVSTGKMLQSATAGLASVTRDWANQSGLVTGSATGVFGKLLVFVAVVVAGLIFVFNPFDVSMLGLPPAAFVVFGLPLLARGSGTRRTPAGRELWSRAGGFQRILSTPSSIERFNFSGRQDLYTAFIPWAVAFDCAREWERKYETEMNQAAPSPVWFYGPYAAGSFISGASGIDSFESSLQSSISAYQATQTSSSSSGGGGFSGGGGGGGGGGGSW